MSRPEPTSISESLGTVLRSLRDEPTTRAGSAGTGSAATSVAAMGGVFGKWQQAVGAAVAHHVQPLRLDGQKLVVEVDDPAWATQLRFLEATLKERLASVAGAVIATIEVRVKRT